MDQNGSRSQVNYMHLYFYLFCKSEKYVMIVCWVSMTYMYFIVVQDDKMSYCNDLPCEVHSVIYCKVVGQWAFMVDRPVPLMH